MIWRALTGKPIAGVGILTVVILAACGKSSDGNRPTGGGRGGQGGETSQDDEDEVSMTLSCAPSDGCPAGEGVCHPDRRVCVECVNDDDCNRDEHCAESTCEAHVACVSTRDCPIDQVCSQSLGRCVECVGDNDCASEQTCHQARCRDVCSSDKDCRAAGGICHTMGVCLECEQDTDCSNEQYCSEFASCVPRVCTALTAMCEDDELATCLENGSGYERTACDWGCASASSCETAPDCVMGDEGCACYPNNTCNGSFSCLSGLCVDGGTGGIGSGGTGTGGAGTGGAGTGGTSTGGAGTGGAGTGGTSTGGAGTGGTGGVGTGGTGGTGGSGTGGSIEECPVTTFQENFVFDTTGPVCFIVEVHPPNGWGIYNGEERSVTVHGVPMNNEQMPLPGDAPYLFEVSAGQHSFASFQYY